MIPPSPATSGRRRTFSTRFSESLSALLVRLKVEDVPHIKRIIVTIAGGTILIFGALLFLTPFPAILVAPVGLAVLGTEYAWARRWLRNAQVITRKAISQTQKIFSSAAPKQAVKAPDEPLALSVHNEPVGCESAGSGTLLG